MGIWIIASLDVFSGRKNVSAASGKEQEGGPTMLGNDERRIGTLRRPSFPLR